MPPSDSNRLLHLYRGLVEVSALINGITDYDALLSAILEVARSVFEVEASSLFLVDGDGNLRLAVARGSLGQTAPPGIVVPRGHGISGWVLEKNEPLLVADAYADERFFREADRLSGFTTRSIVCVPLAREGEALGVLQILNPEGRAAFDQADLEAFVAYAHLVATAIYKIRMLEQRAEQTRVEREVAIAREIQQSFLPAHLPELPSFDAAANYRPALAISGDFYDVQAVSPEEVWFVIGDVSGKGIPAALLMAQAVSHLRLLVRSELDPAQVLSRWNHRVCGTTVRGMFITAIVGRFRLAAKVVEFASAGHPEPFLVGDGTLREVSAKSSPPVGLLAGTSHALNTLVISPGQFLVFFTDGLPDSFDAKNSALGLAGVRRLLREKPGLSAQKIVGRLREGEALHRKEVAPRDDMTILVLGVPS